MSDDVCPISNSHVLTTFNSELLAATGANQKKLDRLVLKWDKEDEDISYLFRMHVGDQIFQLKCRTYKTAKGGIVSKINSAIDWKKFRVENGGDRQVKEYPSITYSFKCGETAFRYWLFYAMYLNYRIGEVDMVLLTNHASIVNFAGLTHIDADNLILTVHDSITQQDFVGDCLKYIPIAIPNVTINMSSNFFAIGGREELCEELLSVKNLTINARTNMKIDFLSKFKGSSFIYNCVGSQSPIGLSEFVEYWQTHRKVEGLKRKIVFNAKHSDWNLSDFKRRIEYDGRKLNNENGIEKLSPPDEKSKNITTFEISNTYLLIEFCPRNVQQ